MIKKLVLVVLIVSLHLVGTAHASAPAHVVNINQGKIITTDPVQDARFGSAIAVDGDTLVIGAPGANGNVNRSGAAYVYQNTSGVWTQAARLTASDGAANDLFGRSVAIHNGVIVVGANGSDSAGPNAGAAYVFNRNGSLWTEAQKLLPAQAGDAYFGFSIAIHNDTIAVGAPYSNSGFTNSGSVYLFDAGPGGWTQTARFATSTGGAVLSDLFGWDVALNNDLLVVGAYLADKVHVYSRSGSTWQNTGQIRGNDTQTNDRFGYSVATDGARILVGATHDDDTGNNAGSAYLFALAGGVWQQTSKFVPGLSHSPSGSNFGWAVDLAGDRAVIGAPNHKGLQDKEESGAAYLYRHNGSNWLMDGLLTANDANQFDHLGTALALSSLHSLAGAPDSIVNPANAGAVYYFDTPGDGGQPIPPQVCLSEESSTEEVLPGMTLTWASAVRCSAAPDQGSYQFDLLVEAGAANTGQAVVQSITLTHTTPRIDDQPPPATIELVTGLPLTIAANESQTFGVTGAYQLAEAGLAKLANLHFCAAGYQQSSGEPFYLGLNAFLRGPGTDDDDNNLSISPAINHIAVLPRSNAATVYWRTDQPATSAVTYSPSASPELLQTITRGCLVRENHQILLTGLLPETVYTFQVHSKSGVDGASSSAEVSFATNDSLFMFLPIINP